MMVKIRGTLIIAFVIIRTILDGKQVRQSQIIWLLLRFDESAHTGNDCCLENIIIFPDKYDSL